MNTIKFIALAATSVVFIGTGEIFKNFNSRKIEDSKIIQKNVSFHPKHSVYSENKIQVALLLDTSNSMDGLIEQAKSRLWNIVNTLTTLKYNGKAPEVEIALYEYGNDGLQDENYIRQVTPLTQDLDLISEKLFALRTNGGNEYCGAVIRDASENLNWDANEKSMKLIYIAGNEPFNQGRINYKDAVNQAKNKNIYTNTIFCGRKEEGIKALWQNGAVLGEGKYFNIDSNEKVIFIKTPFDEKIYECNGLLNDTYISYGNKGYEMKNKQMLQDSNAKSLSASNAVERTVSKSKKNAYKNDHWDLVDKVEKDQSYISTLKEEDLPAELKGKTKAEITKIISQKSADRAKIQREIEVLAKKRQDFINSEVKKRGNSDQDDLGKAIGKSIEEIAKKNGYSF
ncbi:vWA domain-containing protein [Chryseobacterium sp.]|uniref:vWA domain-containing protein n=1 Tax=Chryseobacterium sp. TaxID=1871047 RepID=UPI0028A1826C|nr:vWA domain-containing protein [Chryseobacterium sp.]